VSNDSGQSKIKIAQIAVSFASRPEFSSHRRPEANAHQGPQIDDRTGAILKNLANDTGGSQTLSIELVGNSEQSDESEAFHFVFEVRAGQPGNNWQVAVHDEQDVINRGYAYESTSQAGFNPMERLFFAVAPQPPHLFPKTSKPISSPPTVPCGSSMM
jgi:hypothetical protein